MQEVNKALTANVILVGVIVALGYALGTDALYAEHPWLRTAGYWVGSIILGWWAITFAIPEAIRHISKQIALGKRDAEKESHDED